jgi:hypothetical protein
MQYGPWLDRTHPGLPGCRQRVEFLLSARLHPEVSDSLHRTGERVKVRLFGMRLDSAQNSLTVILCWLLRRRRHLSLLLR